MQRVHRRPRALLGHAAGGDRARPRTTTPPCASGSPPRAPRARTSSAATSRAERRLVAALNDASRPGLAARRCAVLLDLATGAFFTTRARADVRPGRTRARRRSGPRRAGAGGDGGGRARARLRERRAASPRRRASADEAGARSTRSPTTALALHLDAVNRLAWAEYLHRALRRLDPPCRARRRRRPRHRAGPVRPADPQRTGAEHGDAAGTCPRPPRCRRRRSRRPSSPPTTT